jgi:hypothetical protein
MFLGLLDSDPDPLVRGTDPDLENVLKKLVFCWHLEGQCTKIAVSGSASGSISQRHGSADPDPDPHQNIMDPQHCNFGYL